MTRGSAPEDGRLVAWAHRVPDADALLVTNMWPGDPEKPVFGGFVERQVQSLLASGLRADVLYVRGHRSPLAYVVAARRLAAESVRGRRYAVVHALAGEALLSARFHVGAPVVATFRGSDVMGVPDAAGAVSRVWRVRRAAIAQVARLTQATITVSREMEAFLPASVRARNTVIPTGVDRNRFTPLPRDDARRMLGWPPGERVVLFAADPRRIEKGFPLARDVIDRVREELPDARLHVAAQDVPPDAMPAVMSAADCLLLTSTAEGSPNVVKEALACNLPVVSTDVGDVRHLLDGVRPSYVCTADVEHLARAVVACVGEHRRSNGRDASPMLSEAEVARRLMAVYTTVTHGRIPRPAAAPERTAADR